MSVAATFPMPYLPYLLKSLSSADRHVDGLATFLDGHPRARSEIHQFTEVNVGVFEAPHVRLESEGSISWSCSFNHDFLLYSLLIY